MLPFEGIVLLLGYLVIISNLLISIIHFVGQKIPLRAKRVYTSLNKKGRKKMQMMMEIYVIWDLTPLNTVNSEHILTINPMLLRSTCLYTSNHFLGQDNRGDQCLLNKATEHQEWRTAHSAQTLATSFYWSRRKQFIIREESVVPRDIYSWCLQRLKHTRGPHRM